MVKLPTGLPRPQSKTFVAIAAALVASYAMSRFLFSPTESSTPDTGQVTRAENARAVGQLQSVEGTVLIKAPRSAHVAPAQVGPVVAEATIQTQAASAAVIEFTPGPTLRLLENTRLVTEIDPTRDGVIHATLLSGEVTVLNPGANSNFVLQRDGIALDYTSGKVARTVPLIQLESDQRAAPALDLQEKMELERESEMTSMPTTDIQPAEPDAPSAVSKNEEKRNAQGERTGLLRSTLTNDDIRTQVKAQAGSFQKCYVTMVNRMTEDAKPASVRSQDKKAALPRGEMRVAFKILSAGKVTEARVLSSPFQDSIFDRCISEALQRLRFRGFQGATIPVGEFPISLE